MAATGEILMAADSMRIGGFESRSPLSATRSMQIRGVAAGLRARGVVPLGGRMLPIRTPP
jgi:hypothetical protein